LPSLHFRHDVLTGLGIMRKYRFMALLADATLLVDGQPVTVP